MDNNELLKKVLTNLSHIETAHYKSTSSAYNVYDTVQPVYVVEKYFKEYANPQDTFLGASFIRFDLSDTSKMEYSYDGFMRSRVQWEEETIELDSFKTMRFPWREVPAPFFNRAEAIFEYMIKTSDSISYALNDYGDSLLINLTIYDTINVVDFHLGNQSIYFPEVKKAYEMDFSRYAIWIRKSDYLPYKIKRDLPHNISVESISNLQINTDNISKFSAKSYFPNFPLKGRTNKQITKSLIGKPSPTWLLQDTESKFVSLDTFKGRMVLIEFTGIGCGPCHAAIPFLKQLTDDYNEKDLTVLSIETWSNSLNTIRRYQMKQKLNYKILKSDKEVEEKYMIQSVPQFYLLDRNHKIVATIQGYSKNTTDKRIRELIKEHSI